MGYKILFPFLLATILLGGVMHLNAAAQTGEEPWTQPINLSNSGAARLPAATVDANGVVQVIWMDSMAGLQYARYQHDQWSAPRNLDIRAFRQTVPRLVSTKSGYVHAFWIDEKDNLLYSKVVGQYMGDIRSWSAVFKLDAGVVKFDANVDSQGVIHLAYVRTSDEGNSPAGIYYRRSLDEGVHWWQPVRLYESSYIRTLTVDNASIQVASASSGDHRYVYVVWDNAVRKQVAFARSMDNGGKFDPAVEIDKPDLSTNSINPFHIRVGAMGDGVILVWQNGDSDKICNQYYLVSGDAGATWSDPQPMLGNFSGCAQDNTFLPLAKGRFILQTTFQSQVYFLAFDGKQWSEPQFQPGISTFEDPATSTLVSFGCRQLLMVGDDQLYEVGCGSGTSNDIWVTSRKLTSTDDWFLPPPLWSSPTEVFSSTVPLYDLTSAVDAQGRIHTLWSEDETTADRRAVRVIYYSRREGLTWSQGSPVLKPSGEKADQPAITIDPSQRLLVVWSGGASGAITYNWVDAAGAFAIDKWVNTVELPSPKLAGSSPQILVDEQGTIYVSYVIPLNEDRGIYFTQSGDGGATWSNPVKVFDAGANGWEMVGRLGMSRTKDGVFHLIWIRATLPGGIGPLALYYARSEDGGKSWSEPRLVAERPVIWGQVLGVGERTVHILWQEDTPGVPALNHEYSLDGGVTWTQSVSLSGSGDMPGVVALTVDPAGTARLLRVVQDPANNEFVLQHYRWEGGSWTSEEDMPLGSSVAARLTGLAAKVSLDGHLSVLFTAETFIEKTGEFVYTLNYTERNVVLPIAVQQTPELILTPTSEATPTLAPTPTQAPTSTPKLVEPDSPNSGLPLSNSNTGLVIGVGLAALIVILAFGMGIYWRNRLP